MSPSHQTGVLRTLGLMVLLLLLTGFNTGVLAAKPSPGCGNASPKTPSNTSVSVTVNNKARQYFVRVPARYNATNPYRLVLTLHALGGNAGQVVRGEGGYLPYYGLPALDTGETTIYVAPNGLNQGWANQGGEDILLMDAVLAAVEADLCVDQSLRFSTGFSYGGAMSHSIACSRGKEFRAVAVMSSGPLSGCVGGSDPVAYYGQHGVSDNVLTIAMGKDLRDRFVRNNGCTANASTAQPASGSGTHITTDFQGCRAGYPVRWVAFDGDHTPQPKDANQAATWAPKSVWEFFSQFT